MRLGRMFRSPEAKKRKADEKRRRVSFLKGKYQESYLPSEARAPRPPRPKLTLKRATRTVRTILRGVAKQSKKMPSDKAMENFVWGSNEQKKKS